MEKLIHISDINFERLTIIKGADEMNIIKEKNCLFYKKGTTLIEIIVSLALLTIISISFLTMFVQSANSNSKSENIISATYLAQIAMEDLYSLSKSYSLNDSVLQLSNRGYAKTVIISGSDYNFTISRDGYYILIQLRDSSYSGNLVKVVVKVYNNNSMSILEAQMENILSWKN
jgi:type II secretory pathway pseudopilin PulG